jgi:hypothetical protein
MRRANQRSLLGAKIRTIGFLAVMTPLLILVAIVGILSLVFMAPVVIYAGSIRGKPLKPRKSNANAAFR